MAHHPRRESCVKNGSRECRYEFPREPCETTKVVWLQQQSEKNYSALTSPNGERSYENVHLESKIKRRAPFIMIANCCIPLLTVLACNNCITYVSNQLISFYCGAYSKYCKEKNSEYARVMKRPEQYFNKMVDEEQRNAEKRSPFSVGVGRLHSMSRAYN